MNGTNQKNQKQGQSQDKDKDKDKNDLSGVVIVRLIMSSPEQVEKSEMINEMERKIKYRFDPDTRAKIQKIRTSARYRAYEDVVNFHGLKLTDATNLPHIQKVADEADEKLKAVHPKLYANLIHFEIKDRQIKRGKYYRAIYYAILAQVTREMYDKVKDLKSDHLNARSRKTVRNMIQHFHQYNVLNDDEIDEKIEELKTLIDKPTEKIRQTMMEELNHVIGEMQAAMDFV